MATLPTPLFATRWSGHAVPVLASTHFRGADKWAIGCALNAGGSGAVQAYRAEESVLGRNCQRGEVGGATRKTTKSTVHHYQRLSLSSVNNHLIACTNTGTASICGGTGLRPIRVSANFLEGHRTKALATGAFFSFINKHPHFDTELGPVNTITTLIDKVAHTAPIEEGCTLRGPRENLS